MVTNEKISKSPLLLSENGHKKCPKTKSQKYFWEFLFIFLKITEKKVLNWDFIVSRLELLFLEQCISSRPG
jgi:hypothetical protein